MSEGYQLGSAKLFKDFATPFDAFKTAEQDIQFAIDPSKGLTRRRYHWHSNNTFFGGTNVAEDDADGVIDLTTTATGTDTARLQSALSGQYISQTLAQPGVGMEISDSNVSLDGNNHVSLSHGTIATGAGWHDESSGGWGVGGPIQTFVGLKMGESGAEAHLISNGSHIGNSPVSQGNWNLDTMDGSGDEDNPSGLIFKPQNGYIYNFPYTWYAYGALYVGIIHPEKDEPVLFHKFIVDSSSFDRPNLRTMTVVDNGGTASSHSLSVGGMQYALYGARLSQDGEERGAEVSRRTSGTFISNQVAVNNEAIDPTSQVGVPILAIRRASSERDLSIRADELLPEPDNDIYLFAWDEYDDANALSGGTWREPHETLHSTETKIEVNSEATGYTPSNAVNRGWDKATTAKQNEETLSQLVTDDRIPVDATRIYTAVHDGTGADMELRLRAVEGY